MGRSVQIGIGAFIILLIGAALLWIAPWSNGQLDKSIEGRNLSQWTADLQSRDAETRDAARVVLQQNSRAALKFYTAELQAQDSLLRRTTFAVMSFAGVKNKSSNARERHHRAFLGLRALRGSAPLSPKALRVLSEHLLSTNTGLASLNTLINVGSREEILPEIVPALTNGLSSLDPRVRGTALGALKRSPSNDPAAVEALRRSLADSSPTIRRTAAIGLLIVAKDKGEGVNALLPLFRDADPGFRSYAIVHLARYGRAAAPVIPMLIETIREQQDPNLRQLAVDALRRISGDPEQVLLVVADLLVDQDATVRRNAIDAIRSFDSTARNYLATLHRLKQEDPSPDVRRAAGFAIREIQGDGGQ